MNKIDKKNYKKLISNDRGWLLSQDSSPEMSHILNVLETSIDYFFPDDVKRADDMVVKTEDIGGILPKKVHDHNRKLAIIRAMLRHVENDKAIPDEWMAELNCLNRDSSLWAKKIFITDSKLGVPYGIKNDKNNNSSKCM